VLRRIACTTLTLLLAAGGFFGGVLLPPGPLNPVGIGLLALSGALWFGWETIEDVYADEEERRRAGQKIPHPLFVRFAPALGLLTVKGRTVRR
jgi:hypothetical protein